MTKITVDKALLEQAVEAHAWALDHLPNGAAQTKVRSSIKALRAALADPAVEPVGWSITWHGDHTGNFYQSRETAEVRMVEANQKYQGEVRAIVPLFASPPPPAVHDAAYKEAKYLAEALFKKHYARDECYASGAIEWGLCDNTAGIISQIDNMVCQLVKPPASAAQFNAAINFAITQGSEAATFLDAWRHGDTSEWPEFEAVRQKAGLQ